MMLGGEGGEAMAPGGDDMSSKPGDQGPTAASEGEKKVERGPGSKLPAPAERVLPKFGLAEKVLCFHGPVLYQAKVLMSRQFQKSAERMYRIHYNGWNKRTDTWVYEHRLLKYNEANLKVQKDLQVAIDEERKAAAALKAKPGAKTSKSKKRSVASDSQAQAPEPGSSTSSEAEASGSGGCQKKGKENVESESLFRLKQEVEIRIPEKLKLLLVDDWNAVVKDKRLAILPARVTIDGILQEYLESKEGGDVNVIKLCDGLRNYFNRMIGAQLLYPCEQEQHKKLANRDENKPMTEYYGLAHLMRLFSKLGGCLTYTGLGPKGVATLQTAIVEFFKFLIEKYETYFSTKDYGVN